ncbi:toll/interleukin-1 receptor domain-containing protein [Pseudomonas syringae]
MYNLLMTAGEDDWNNPTWTIGRDRFLEHTVPTIKERYLNLSPDALQHLRQIPALFAYEEFRDQSARVGRVTEIQQLQNALRITLAIDQRIQPIPQRVLSTIYAELDINARNLEHCRTHWALKDIDLPTVLTANNLSWTAQLQPQRRPPKVFVSYSWDSPEHRQWVAHLAASLRANGIDAILDQWHVRGGEDLAAFMERSVREADRVLVICTDGYYQRAVARQGGVGYEHSMITGELMRNVGSNKFIPIVRQLSPQSQVPPELSGRLRFDLGVGPDYHAQLNALVRDLHDVPTPVPPLGQNPFL